jgi:Flp pilus assembly pilin Flp
MMVRLIIERVWTGIVAFVQTVIDGVKNAWQGFSGFMGGLWDGIASITMSVWSDLKDWFSGLVDGIKSIWNGIVGFFSGLWEAILQGPEAAIEYIKNAFFNLFDTIQQKLFGFINKIREGWDSVKGFFGGLWEGAVNFVTGGPSNTPDPKPVNDMILTPEGRFDTDPADYILAMKNPTDLSGRAAYNAASPVNNYRNSQQSVSINVNSQITTAVPAGTPAEQRSSLQRQAREAVRNEWAQVIQGARGLIPSPEGRTAL